MGSVKTAEQFVIVFYKAKGPSAKTAKLLSKI